MARDRQDGIRASSSEFARYDQVGKPDYRLAESADSAEAFDEDFRIRTLDLGRFLDGGPEEQRSFADDLVDAMREIGFVILEGHGIDPRRFDEAEQLIEPFFADTPMATKQSFRAARHGAVREGYFPIKETSDIHPDLVEGWVFGRRAFDLDDHPQFVPDALWPRPEFEPEFRRLVGAELPLFSPIMQAILMGIGCDPHLYDARLSAPHFGLRLNYYPPLRAADGASGAGRLLGHEDVDLFTLLPAPTVEGLQVLHSSGKWVRVDAPRHSIILNTGDYLQRISNDILRSTTHRVAPPRDRDLRSRSRVSFPLAAYLPPDDVLEVLPGIENPKYEPVKVITFHTRTTAKFYGDDYAVESPIRE